jgi:hypothetical protein
LLFSILSDAVAAAVFWFFLADAAVEVVPLDAAIVVLSVFGGAGDKFLL